MGYMNPHPVFETPGYSMYGGAFTARETINDRFDMRNCETVIMLGLNPAWSSCSMTYNWMQVKKAGAKFILIDPYFNDTGAVMDAEWIPIRPVTDSALLLGIAHTLITEDDPDTNPLIDWDFLNRCTIGFDAEHMPEGADPKENFKDYVLGTYDDTPKDAEWASEICGAKPDKIRYLARELRKDKKVALVCGWAHARTNSTDSLPQLFATIGAMTGHIGKSGHMTGPSCFSYSSNGGLPLVKTGSSGLPSIKNHIDDCINIEEVYSAVFDGKYKFTGNAQFLPAEERDINIQMIYHHGIRNRLQNTEDINRGIEAHREVEFVVAQNIFLTTSALYADLVLPETTEWETVGGFLGSFWCNREIMLTYRQVTPPLYEAKTAMEIDLELGKLLGFTEEELYPISAEQQYFNELATCTVVQEDGETFGPLVTITEENIASWGVEGKPQEGKISLNEFLEKGVYQVKRTPGDQYGYIAFEDFVKDPEANPMQTSASGKIEIYSEGLAERINAMGYSEIKPYPAYIPSLEGYESTFNNWETKEKGDFPYQLYTPHYLRRSHTSFHNVPWLREAFTNSMFISAPDAKGKNINNGDTVLVESKYGKSLRNAVVTERMMPGVVSLPHGAWAEIDEEAGVDKAGSDNVICGQSQQTGQGTSGYNSNVVNIEKYSGDSLAPDVEWPQRIIF